MKLPGAHFSDEQWSDFVRGLLAAVDQAAMRTHLDSGCVPCGQSVRLFTAVAAAGAAPVTEVPRQLTAAAVAVFKASIREHDWIEKLTPLLPRLILGPGLHSQPAGVRSIGIESNRVVYRAGDYAVDLSLESSEPADRREMVGQITHEHEPEKALEGVIVQVLASGKTVSETATNKFGEFVIELPARNRAILRFALKQQGHRIDLPLKIPMTRSRQS